MHAFTIALAGIGIGITTQTSSAASFFLPYYENVSPDFSIMVSEADIIQERERANAEYPVEDRPLDGFPKCYLEQQFLLHEIAEKLPAYDAMLVHGSAIMVAGKAYLFTAPSGTGKSTHSRLWRELLGDRVVMINDDKPFLRFKNGVIYVCGSPWRGKHNLGENTCAPLAGLCILSQSPTNSIKRLAPSEALHSMLQQCYKPVNADSVLRTLTLIDQVLAEVPVYHLSCNMDISAAEMSCLHILK